MEKYYSVTDVLKVSAEKYKDKPAFLIDSGAEGIKSVYYGEFVKDAEALALALKERLGLEGKHIGIMAKNSYYWCVSYFAALFIGTAVPLDRDIRGEAAASLLEYGDVSAVICDSVCARELQKSGADQEIICIDKEKEDSFRELELLIAYGRRRLSEEADIICNRKPEEMAVLLFTSGTTGSVKGVMLSHSNIISDLEAVSERVSISDKDRSLSVLPLHHTYEAITMLMMIKKGGTVCFSSSYKNLIRDFSVYHPTVLVCVPLLLEKFSRKLENEMKKRGRAGKSMLAAMVSGVMSEEGRRRLYKEIHSLFGGELRKLIVGAAPLDKSIAEKFESYGFSVIIGYGLTECSPIVICNSDTERRTDSVGRPLSGACIRIFEPDSNGIGEITVRGPMVMLGYYKNKGATDGVMRDGWFHTGDLGYADKDGFYYITGRLKNVIVTPGGKNIYPEELEGLLLKSPLVSECMVFQGKNGEICASVLPDLTEIMNKSGKPELLQADVENYINAVVKTVNRRLIPYKRIKTVILRDNPFEKTSTHKIKR